MGSDLHDRWVKEDCAREAEAESKRLRAEVEHLRKQRDELQESNTKTLQRARSAEAQLKWVMDDLGGPDRSVDVVKFFYTVGDGHNVGGNPHVPPLESLRLGLLLLVEESGETVLACFPAQNSPARAIIEDALRVIQNTIASCKESDFKVDLPALTDGVIDTEYVAEGLAIRCGIQTEPCWNIVHAANMSKAAGPRDPVTGKRLKPEGFVPPDIAGELRRQGWDDGRGGNGL